MEIKIVWAISRNHGEWMSFYDTKDEAVREARALTREDRKTITGIYQTFAGDAGNRYEELWCQDLPEFNSSWGIRLGESVDEGELEDIIKNGRNMD